MLTAFGPIGRWKLAGAAQGAGAGGDDGGIARRRQLYTSRYQRFRHHLWLIRLMGGV